jgi:hypothetical protein
MFAEDSDKQQHFIQLIEADLIKPENGLLPIVQQLIAYAKSPKNVAIDVASISDFNEPLRSFLQANQHQLTTMAIDVPIFLKAQKETAKTIMICAMDPLPPLPTSAFWHNKNVQFNETVGFWAPFSLIDDWNHPTGSMRTNISFFKTLLSNYNLYVTDIYKLFFRFEQSGNYIASNAIQEYTSLLGENGRSFHGNILAKEIELVNPCAILTLGNAARDKLLAINYLLNNHLQPPTHWGDDFQQYLWNNSIPLIASPHISGAANGAKAKIVSNERYKNLNGLVQNERLANIVLAHIESKLSIL